MIWAGLSFQLLPKPLNSELPKIATFLPFLHASNPNPVKKVIYPVIYHVTYPKSFLPRVCCTALVEMSQKCAVARAVLETPRACKKG